MKLSMLGIIYTFIYINLYAIYHLNLYIFINFYETLVIILLNYWNEIEELDPHK